MNFVLAVLLYAIMAGVGAEVPEAEVDNRVGKVAPDSPAATAPMYRVAAEGAEHAVDKTAAPDALGWQTGDRVVSINGHKVGSIKDATVDAILGAGKTLSVVIERIEKDGTVQRYVSPVEPKAASEDGYTKFGVFQFDTALVGYVMPGTPAEACGLRKGDIIVRANGAFVDRTTFVELVEGTPEGEALALEIERDGARVIVDCVPRTVGRFLGLATAPDIDLETHATDQEQPRVVGVSPDFQARILSAVAVDSLGRALLPGDIIEEINGQPASVALLHAIETSSPGQEVQFEIRRPAVLWGYLREERTMTVAAACSPVRAIGIQFGVRMVYHREPLVRVMPEACRQTYQAVRRTLQTLLLLAMGRVSPRELGGPVMIYHATTTAAREGYWWLLSITAFISANLGVINLVPLPVLDGGLLVCFVVEGIRRKPLSVRVQQRIQQVGLVLIIGLVIFVTFNDVSRWVASLLP